MPPVPRRPARRRLLKEFKVEKHLSSTFTTSTFDQDRHGGSFMRPTTHKYYLDRKGHLSRLMGEPGSETREALGRVTHVIGIPAGTTEIHQAVRSGKSIERVVIPMALGMAVTPAKGRPALFLLEGGGAVVTNEVASITQLGRV